MNQVVDLHTRCMRTVNALPAVDSTQVPSRRNSWLRPSLSDRISWLSMCASGVLDVNLLCARCEVSRRARGDEGWR